MAKISYIISKKSDKSGKSNFHFNNDGGFKWFEIFHKNNEQYQTENANEITNLISRFETDFEGTAKVDTETRFELEGSMEELKELGSFAVSYLKEEGNFLKSVAIFIKEYFKSILDLVRGVSGSILEYDNLNEEISSLKEENKKIRKELKEYEEVKSEKD